MLRPVFQTIQFARIKRAASGRRYEMQWNSSMKSKNRTGRQWIPAACPNRRERSGLHDFEKLIKYTFQKGKIESIKQGKEGDRSK